MSDHYSGKAFNKGIVNYVGGRFLNAVAAFFILIWIARQLPELQYVNYIAAYSIVELGIIFSSFGMEWVTGIYIPQMRIKGSGASLARCVWHSAASGLPRAPESSNSFTVAAAEPERCWNTTASPLSAARPAPIMSSS